MGEYPHFKNPEDDSSPPSREWELADYDRFLQMFGESPCPNVRESKTHVRKLNLNLYDLLDWIRNPNTAVRPERFSDVRALAEYSFTCNKVFPFWHAIQSQIASPFLRPLGVHFGFRSIKRARNYVVVAPPTDATNTESSAAQVSSNEKPCPSADENLDSTAIGVLTGAMEVGAVKNDKDEVADVGTGASLFTLSDAVASAKGLGVPSRRRRAFNQDKIISCGGGMVAIASPQ